MTVDVANQQTRPGRPAVPPNRQLRTAIFVPSSL